MSDALKDLLKIIREHPGFDELLTKLQAPRTPRFTAGKIGEHEQFLIETIFKSGKREQHSQWLSLLTGKPQETND